MSRVGSGVHVFIDSSRRKPHYALVIWETGHKTESK